jgi:hypothetical protein
LRRHPAIAIPIRVAFRLPVDRITLSSVCDIPGRAHESVGHAPGLPVFVEIDDPDDVIVMMSGFDKVCDTFAGRAGPARAADDDSSQRGVQLKHAKGISKSMPGRMDRVSRRAGEGLEFLFHLLAHFQALLISRCGVC